MPFKVFYYARKKVPSINDELLLHYDIGYVALCSFRLLGSYGYIYSGYISEITVIGVTKNCCTPLTYYLTLFNHFTFLSFPFSDILQNLCQFTSYTLSELRELAYLIVIVFFNSGKDKCTSLTLFVTPSTFYICSYFFYPFNYLIKRSK